MQSAAEDGLEGPGDKGGRRGGLEGGEAEAPEVGEDCLDVRAEGGGEPGGLGG